MNTKITFSIIAFAIVASTLAVVLNNSIAFAKISEVPTSCTNQGGNQPGGQQPSCQGSGLTQESENQNPAGSAPPGQNR